MNDLYSSLSGAVGAWQQLEVVANNVANAQTTGFKRERLTYEAQGPDSAYARVADGMIDHSDGAPRSTGNPLDVAVQGRGWLMVDAASEGASLTRDGHLHVDPQDGTLRTAGGHAVVGEQGTIVVPLDQTVAIEADGTVRSSDGELIDRLRIVDGPAEAVGGNLWRATGTLVDREPTLIPGALESSNVDPVISMVELIEASRTFEMMQQAMKTSDELDARLNELGRV